MERTLGTGARAALALLAGLVLTMMPAAAAAQTRDVPPVPAGEAPDARQSSPIKESERQRLFAPVTRTEQLAVLRRDAKLWARLKLKLDATPLVAGNTEAQDPWQEGLSITPAEYALYAPNGACLFSFLTDHAAVGMGAPLPTTHPLSPPLTLRYLVPTAPARPNALLHVEFIPPTAGTYLVTFGLKFTERNTDIPTPRAQLQERFQGAGNAPPMVTLPIVGNAGPTTSDQWTVAVEVPDPAPRLGYRLQLLPPETAAGRWYEALLGRVTIRRAAP